MRFDAHAQPIPDPPNRRAALPWLATAMLLAGSLVGLRWALEPTPAPATVSPPRPVSAFSLPENTSAFPVADIQAMATTLANPLAMVEVTFTPTPKPPVPAMQATAEAQMTAVARVNATATAAARPKWCEDGMPKGTLCIQPLPTSTPVPTWTPVADCPAPPGELCYSTGRMVPALPTTPTPASYDPAVPQ